MHARTHAHRHVRSIWIFQLPRSLVVTFSLYTFFYVFYVLGVALSWVEWSFVRLGEQQLAWREREIGNPIEDLQGVFL